MTRIIFCLLLTNICQILAKTQFRAPLVLGLQQMHDCLSSGKTVTFPNSPEQMLSAEMWKFDSTVDGLSAKGNVLTSATSSCVSALVTFPIMKSSYIEFTIHPKSNGVFVGVTTMENFKPGYGLVGCLYGGNLSNGSGLRVSNYGPFLTTGEEETAVVGMLVTTTKDQNATVWYSFNGKSLGTAYEFSLDEINNNTLHPVVQLNGSGSISVTATLDVSKIIAGPPESLYEANDLFSGDWGIDSRESNHLIYNSTTISVSAKDKKLRGSFKMGNTLMFDGEKVEDRSFSIRAGGSTLMMPSPDAMESENFLKERLAEGAVLKVEENGKLVISTKNHPRFAIFVKKPLVNNPCKGFYYK